MAASDEALDLLAQQLDGELFSERATRLLYATDASTYQEIPRAVAFPRSESDIQRLITFAREHEESLIPRTAGTSIAGQVVGGGIVVDVSRHFTSTLHIDRDQQQVRVQPGVIRNELNAALRKHGLMFAPETSTANRAMIGGMVGNNSCGSNSIVYGSTREHLVSLRGFLSDGSEAEFSALDEAAFAVKCDGPESLETNLYRDMRDLLSDPAACEEILREFPKASVTRRNTGYALDTLLDSPFNFCRLLAGSEGTLFFITEITLQCVPLPPPQSGLLCAHFNSIDEALRATLVAMPHRPYACELIDHFILDCTKTQIEHRRNRFFVEGDPAAILAVEFRGETMTNVEESAAKLTAELQQHGLGTHYPLVIGDDQQCVWNIRKAGLGLLSNVPGDAKPVAVIEDTAVAVEDLPAYIQEFNRELKSRFDVECVQYAHAGAGELHLRPLLNLKTTEGQTQFREIARFTAELVKKYQGSLSGEHGDGRLRGEFLKDMIGKANYQRVRRVKQTWDPQGIFNPGKIVDTPPMNTSLRYAPDQDTPVVDTVFDFSGTQGILRAAEMCNGSGDCRKTELAGGTMCPSYMATRDEKDTTRGRANMLRHVLTNSRNDNPFDDEALADVMDLCISCKGCKSECPSNVDMARLKAEFLHHYQQANGISRRTRAIAGFASAARWGSIAPGLWNLVAGSRLTRRALGFTPHRSLPRLSSTPLKKWIARRRPVRHAEPKGTVHLFCDEFTQYNDPHVGRCAVELLERLGYRVEFPRHRESARAALSKGLLDKARAAANANVRSLSKKVTAAQPLIGLEPSALLGFRDEYPDLVDRDLAEPARALSANCLLLEEFLVRELDAGRIRPDQFTDQPRDIEVHGHCHQKAIASLAPTLRALSIPANYIVRAIPSGCCGMAGSFGYEKEHYDLSMQIGELVLFPAVRELAPETLVAAPGTSCREQILHGTGRTALHPAEILHGALRTL